LAEDRSWKKYKSLTDAVYDCRKWETEHTHICFGNNAAHSFISGNTEMGTRHGFSPALHLQCGIVILERCPVNDYTDYTWEQYTVYSKASLNQEMFRKYFCIHFNKFSP
jgi:hypothetical protein